MFIFCDALNCTKTAKSKFGVEHEKYICSIRLNHIWFQHIFEGGKTSEKAQSNFNPLETRLRWK